MDSLSFPVSLTLFPSPDILALSGPGGSHLDLFSATSGHLIWSLTQHSLQDGLLPEPGSLATDAVFYHPYTETAALDVISLANGKEIRRIDGRTGQTIWRWTLNTPDESVEIWDLFKQSWG